MRDGLRLNQITSKAWRVITWATETCCINQLSAWKLLIGADINNAVLETEYART